MAMEAIEHATGTSPRSTDWTSAFRSQPTATSGVPFENRPAVELGSPAVLSSEVINSKQPNLGLTQESLRMVTARVLVVLSGSFTSQIETGPTLT